MNKGKLGGEFAEGLDDIDGGGATKKTTHAARAENATGEGGREFVNLGASARVGGDPRGEEEKQSDRPTGIKPTFRGKLNTRGAENDNNSGVVTSYGFEVALRTEPREKREDGQDGEQVRKLKPKPRGQAFGAKDEDSDSDGFEVVQGRKPRRVHKEKRDSESDEGGDAPYGGARGGRGGGRGGFFKNSGRPGS